MSCANARVLRHRRTFEYWVGACMRWRCPDCIRSVARRWRRILNWSIANGSAPAYFLTLTLRDPLPLWREAPADQQAALRQQALTLAESLTRALSRLVEEIRQQFGPFEYMAVVELTTGTRTPGHRPHLHLLVRGPALPHGWLRARWQFHSKGSFVVDIQPLRSPELAGDYVIAYAITPHKQAQRAHLTDWPGPRIRYSRKFFPRPVPEIRAILWPPVEPGMWEYIGLACYPVQLTFEALLLHDDRILPVAPATG